MKKLILLLVTFCLVKLGNSQLVITAGAQWVNNGNAVVILNDMDLVVDGTYVPGGGLTRFMGNQNSNISGSGAVNFNILDILKTANAKLLLQRTVNVGYSVNFIVGNIDLNNNNILLAPTAYLSGEIENSRIVGANGGYVEITQDLNAPLLTNPGNLGAIISSSANLGSVTIRRGHNPLSGTGLTSSLSRHFNILPANNSSLDATVRIKYFDGELNGQTENTLVQFKSSDNGSSWTNQSFTTRDAATNYVEKNGHNTMSIFTLAADNTVEPPPPATDGVTGLVFHAKRKKATEVELTWTTATETNMNGFEVQRRQKNEADFLVRGFVNTKAPGGNSAVQLSYLYKDPNTYTDTSFYRLKIVDNNGGFTYSEIKFVAPKAKGGGNGGGGNGNGNNREMNVDMAGKPAPTTTTELQAKITVGPNPNNGNFWFIVSGIDKETSATLLSIDGRIIRQFKVVNQKQYPVNNLSNGTYLLKVPGLDAFKVMVQGSGSQVNNNPVNPGMTKY